jgi:hypothetical protein
MPEGAGSRSGEGGGSGGGESAGAPQGLAWSWEIDLEELLAAITGQEGQGSGAGQQPGEAGQLADLDPAHAVGQGVLDARQGRPLSAAEMAGLVAGRMAPGPGLAALLAATSPTDLADYALPDVAAAYRRIGSWAQARELACVAQIAARAAARDPRIGVGADGRPAQVTGAACAEVSLALTLTGAGAEWWTDLAVTLSWQLIHTGAALRDGVIDLARARLIAEATCLLDEDAAREVEEKILPDAAEKTTGALRAALRRAVIAADPAGAERRREEAERRARVVLYPDAESTASLAGQGLPGVHATAAMAKIKAMARALKASGAPEPMDFLCARVYIGLLLGTLPPIPPAEPGPPDEPDADYDPPDADYRPAGGGGPSNADGRGCGSGPPAGYGRPGDGSPSDRESSGGGFPAGGQGSSPSDGTGQNSNWTGRSAEPAWPDLPARIQPGRVAPGTTGSSPARPAGGLLDLAVPWATLAGVLPEPGWLGRLGPVTPVQARRLADVASRAPATQWRIILVSPSGQARAIARIPRLRDGPGGRASNGGACSGLVGRVTLTIPDTVLNRPPPDPADQPSPPGPALPDSRPGRPGPVFAAAPPGRPAPAAQADPAGNLGRILAAALRAAAQAATRADAAEAADGIADGCAHHAATDAYRPPPSLRDLVAARDLTCRFPTCRQPVWRCDLDHTLPWNDGGRTCSCNLGGLCRAHHQIKQHPFWTLRQDRPGIFRWTTPAGRSYVITPDVHPA